MEMIKNIELILKIFDDKKSPDEIKNYIDTFKGDEKEALEKLYDIWFLKLAKKDPEHFIFIKIDEGTNLKISIKDGDINLKKNIDKL